VLETSKATLTAIAHTLEDVRNQDPSSPMAASGLQMSAALLKYVLLTEREVPSLVAEQQEALRALWGHAEATLPDFKERLAAVDIGSGPHAKDSTFADWAEILAALVRARADTPAGEQLDPLISEIAEGLAAPGRAILRGVFHVAAKPSMTETGTRLGARSIETYLHAREDKRWQLPVIRVEYMPGGFSKETILVQLRGGDATEELVLRKVIDGQPIGNLVEEWNMVELAWNGGIPVPEPLWLEPTHTSIGNAFFAVRRVPGKNHGDVWGKATNVPRAAGIQLAQALAKLHRIDVELVGSTPAAPMVTQEDLLAAIDAVDIHPDSSDIEEATLYAGLIEWLRSHIPATPHQPALLHGDVGFHNMLIEGERISGLLDWERAHLGDPAEELAYVRPSVEGVLAWNEFLEAYRDAGGQTPDSDVIRFYEVWQDVWRASACLHLRNRFLTSDDPRLNHAMAGLTFGPRFVLSAARNAFHLSE
jgi:aminoglycoside phosphotransferase (APT) family kinase protein